MSQAGEIDVIGNNPEIPTLFIADVGSAVPIANTLEILGTSVAAGTTPVETTGSGNTLTVEVQTAQESAVTDATKIGLALFDSTAFDVDANGFVTLTGGGGATTNIDVDAHTAPGTDPVVPSGGNIIITGAQVASGVVGTNVIRTDSLAANTVTIEIQRSTAVAATDITKNGVAHFDSAAFSVDANGFVQLAGGGLAIDSIHPDSGTDPVVPTVAGLVNIVGSGSTTTVGSLNTLTVQLTGLTNHAVLVGAGTSTITKVGPTATIGQVLQSAGAAADPAFSTATYPLTTTINQILYSSAANTITGLATANRGVLTTTSAGVPVITALATDGQLIIGSTAGAPAAASITSSDGSVTVTSGSNSISLTVAGGTSVGKTITGDTGGALSPTAGNWNITGQGTPNTTGIQTTGSGSTLNVQMFSPFALGNFAFSRSASGATNTLTVENTSNTASSNSLEQITVAGTSAGDPFQTFTVSGTTNWSQGIDNSVSDNFVLAASTALGTTNVMSATTGGAVSYVLGNVDVTRSASGADVSLTASNSSNTASSSATLYATAAGTSAGDARTQYAVSGTTTWTQGIDNSVTGDPFVISASSALGTTNIMSATTAGEINYPLQPAFLANQASLQSNVTGDGTGYTAVFTTEIFDQNSDYSSPTFTAPVTGRYFLELIIELSNIPAGTSTMNSTIVTSNRNYTTYNFNPLNVRNGGLGLQWNNAIFADMDAADTSSVNLNGSGGTKTVSYSANGASYFGGHLVC